MPLRLDVENSVQRQQLDHDAGPLEIGRGPQRALKRFQILGDPSVSRDQLRIEEQPGGRVRLENLSQHIAVVVPDRCHIPELQSQELDLPVLLTMGHSRLSIALAPRREVGPQTPSSRADQCPPCANSAVSTPDDSTLAPGFVSIPASFQTTCPPAEQFRPCEPGAASVPAGDLPRRGLISIPAAEQIGRWLQRILELQETGTGSPEFYGKTARALVDLVGLDLGLVLLNRDGSWSIAGSAMASDRISIHYSQTLLNHVVTQRKTFYEDLDQLDISASMVDLEAGVAAPIFGLQQDVVGVLYGVRVLQEAPHRGAIEPLEAQMVQLLAAAVGAQLARSAAQRTRVQFEQFFSPDLVRELERDAKLL
jgi:adenylate cyclase